MNSESSATPATRDRSALLIIGATVVAGITGYAVTFVVFRATGAAAYSVFAVFWAALYLVIGGLSGIQQEIARATHRIDAESRTAPSRARTFGIVTAGVVFLLVVVSSPLWSSASFRTDAQALVLPLAVGSACYVLVATMSGSLYGVSQWRSVALLVAADGVLRLVLLLVALLFTRDIVVLAWVVALPFPLALVLSWRFIRGGFVGRSDLDVGYRALTWNVARTVLASASTAILVSGFPLLLGLTAKSEPGGLVGQLIFTITLTRAPLIVSVMALQSYFVVRFRDGARSMSRTLLYVLLAVIIGTLLLAGLGWLFGAPLLEWVSGSRHISIEGNVIAVLIASSGLVAALSVTGSAVLARSRHLVYSSGWFAAAIVTIGVMLTGIDFIPRVETALILGPAAGLLFHLAVFAARPRRVAS
ncbi:hypothetical protein F1C58_03035 [Glaciihabitans sp. INWT7]|uniref:hypothetical protein n=1 Tax=Glaciihabitans sp. INWT7 TaxID=2596912 RepID=UPI00162927BF|nr:hypothetical protein [Glaciihabitans sp. INWT7]QNE45987.1 hypothetical protein F1C58_03035 [Glaciihabitans sp. INWT7]